MFVYMCFYLIYILFKGYQMSDKNNQGQNINFLKFNFRNHQKDETSLLERNISTHKAKKSFEIIKATYWNWKTYTPLDIAEDIKLLENASYFLKRCSVSKKLIKLDFSLPGYWDRVVYPSEEVINDYGKIYEFLANICNHDYQQYSYLENHTIFFYGELKKLLKDVGFREKTIRRYTPYLSRSDDDTYSKKLRKNIDKLKYDPIDLSKDYYGLGGQAINATNPINIKLVAELFSKDKVHRLSKEEIRKKYSSLDNSYHPNFTNFRDRVDALYRIMMYFTKDQKQADEIIESYHKNINPEAKRGDEKLPVAIKPLFKQFEERYDLLSKARNYLLAKEFSNKAIDILTNMSQPVLPIHDRGNTVEIGFDVSYPKLSAKIDDEYISTTHLSIEDPLQDSQYYIWDLSNDYRSIDFSAYGIEQGKGNFVTANDLKQKITTNLGVDTICVARVRKEDGVTKLINPEFFTFK